MQGERPAHWPRLRRERFLTPAECACGDLLRPVLDAIRRATLSEFLISLDDMPVVVRNGGAKGRTTGRVWDYRSRTGNMHFDFRMDRSSAGPLDVLGEFRGYVQCDAYSGHDCLFRGTTERTELGCWSHVVRKFDDAKSTSKQLSRESSIRSALLFRVETEARGMSPPQRQAFRLQHAVPVLDEIRQWLEARQSTVAPKSRMTYAEDANELTTRRWRESAAAQESIAAWRQELRAAVQALCFSD